MSFVGKTALVEVSAASALLLTGGLSKALAFAD